MKAKTATMGGWQQRKVSFLFKSCENCVYGDETAGVSPRAPFRKSIALSTKFLNAAAQHAKTVRKIASISLHEAGNGP